MLRAASGRDTDYVRASLEPALRFSVVTAGSEGDTRPLAALCRGLLDCGHEVKRFADHSTLSLPRLWVCPAQLQGDIKSILPIADPRQKLRFSDVVARCQRAQG